MKNLFLTLLTAFMLTGCLSEPPGQLQTIKYETPEGNAELTPSQEEANRLAADFEIIKISTFKDNGAYNSNRSLFLLRRKSTGQEFIGISGVGISDLGSHRSGKHNATDER